MPYLLLTPTSSWHVRPFEAGDEAALLSLYTEVFGRTRTLEVWRWKLQGREAPYPTVWVAEDTTSHRIVGHYGGIPLRLKVGSDVLPAVHAVEAMTSQSHRGQGVLTALGTRAHAAWAAAGNALILGLPNEQWGTRNRALGYRDLFPLTWLRFPVRLDAVIEGQNMLPAYLTGPARALGRVSSTVWGRLHKLSLQSDVKVDLVHMDRSTARGNFFDPLWQRLAPAFTNVVVRDEPWVAWRYLECSEPRYHVLAACVNGEPYGYLAYRLLESTRTPKGLIVDLFTHPDQPGVAATLIWAALDALAAQGAGTVLTLAPPGSSQYSLLRRFGFLPTRQAFSFEIVPLDGRIDAGVLADARAWHLTGGDFDVV